MGSCCIAQGAQLSALWWPRGVVWGAGGIEAQEGGDICILIADLQLPNGQLKFCNKNTLQHCNKTMIVLDFFKKMLSQVRCYT